MILWGVTYGGVVRRVFDGGAAFQEEAALRSIAQYADACAVVSRDGGRSWVRVPAGSTVRAAPVPPARAMQRPQIRPGVHRWVRRALLRLGVGSRPDAGWCGGVFWRR
jgi:hypothetical protein